MKHTEEYRKGYQAGFQVGRYGSKSYAELVEGQPMTDISKLQPINHEWQIDENELGGEYTYYWGKTTKKDDGTIVVELTPADKA